MCYFQGEKCPLVEQNDDDLIKNKSFTSMAK